MQAKGKFEVKLDRQEMHAALEGSTFGRMSIDKKFEGDLVGASRGEMLSAMTAVKGSAGYVAIEEVTGTLDGKTGTFVLQHNATMDRGRPLLNVIVVPDSGTGELVGITGKLDIIIEGKDHSYVFDYNFSAE